MSNRLALFSFHMQTAENEGTPSVHTRSKCVVNKFSRLVSRTGQLLDPNSFKPASSIMLLTHSPCQRFRKWWSTNLGGDSTLHFFPMEELAFGHPIEPGTQTWQARSPALCGYRWNETLLDRDLGLTFDPTRSHSICTEQASVPAKFE